MKTLDKLSSKNMNERRLGRILLIPPALLLMLFLLHGCNSEKSLQHQRVNVTGTGMNRYSICIQHLSTDRLAQVMFELTDNLPYCQVLEVSQSQPVFFFQTSQNDLVVTVSATAESVKLLGRELMNSGGWVKIVRE